MTVDLRRLPAMPSSSIAEGSRRRAATGKVILLVDDEELEGQSRPTSWSSPPTAPSSSSVRRRWEEPMTELDDLDRLAAEVFEGYLVRKDLAQQFRGQYPVPTYVGEFLLGRYCATTDPDEIAAGLEMVAAVHAGANRPGR